MPKQIVLRVDNSIEERALPDVRTLPEAQAEAVARIKTEAGARILAAYPIHVQMNGNARGVELLETRTVRAWTPAEADEVAALKAMRAAIKAVRDASNEAEAAVLAATTREEADAVVADWP